MTLSDAPGRAHGHTRPKALLTCGCAAMGTLAANGGPFCPIHDCGEIAPDVPDLAARRAKCSCGASQPSSLALPFFRHQPGRPADTYYCGCRGWD